MCFCFSVTSDFNPRIYLVNQCVFAGSIAGFFIGGRIGARVGAVEHVETTKLAVYKSVTHAQVCNIQILLSIKAFMDTRPYI